MATVMMPPTLTTETPTHPAAKTHLGLGQTENTHRLDRIGQLSDLLRARLQYAKVKVENGWQDLNLLSESPNQQQRAQASSQTSRSVKTTSAEISRKRSLNGSKAVLQSPKTTQALGVRSAELTADPFPELYYAQSYAKRPRLDPPIDLLPRSAPNSQHLTASRKASEELQDTIIASTRRSLGPRTPSQQAASEKDAVEMLVSMSSPHRSSQLLRSPQSSPSEPGLSQRLMSFQSPSRTGIRMSPSAPIFVTTKKEPMSESEIDKLLDSMADESEDDI